MSRPLTRQAITTKYIPMTNTRQSRVKATSQAGSVIVRWNYDLNVEENHRAAALALAAKFDWQGPWCAGALPDGQGYAFVCLAGVSACPQGATHIPPFIQK